MRSFLFADPHDISRAAMLAYLKLLLSLRSVRSLTGGLQRLPEALAAGLHVRLGHHAVEVAPHRRGDGAHPPYRVQVVSPEGTYTIGADAVVCATTATAAARILTPLPDRTKDTLAGVRYASAAVLNCTLDRRIASPSRWVLNMARQASAVAIMRIIPGGAQGRGDGLTLWSPGGTVGAELCDLADDQVLGRMTQGAAAAGPGFELGRHVTAFRVDRWTEALPQFPVGHLRRLHELHTQLPAGLALAGDYLAGQNLEAAITSGIRAADRVTTQLAQRHTTPRSWNETRATP
ncbi:FAD-dependent oxidoreductase [Streptomyces sp. NPDC059708]|uniref:FAD-dependent oxidoreductase n=1 Tax=Streptomyces sp. NPDC059708 TaxID=3346916 RepID=UPI0036916A63